MGYTSLISAKSNNQLVSSFGVTAQKKILFNATKIAMTDPLYDWNIIEESSGDTIQKVSLEFSASSASANYKNADLTDSLAFSQFSQAPSEQPIKFGQNGVSDTKNNFSSVFDVLLSNTPLVRITQPANIHLASENYQVKFADWSMPITDSKKLSIEEESTVSQKTTITVSRYRPQKYARYPQEYAILFGGEGKVNSDSDYLLDDASYDGIKKMYTTLIKKGFQAENIYILYTDGLSSEIDRYDVQGNAVSSDWSFAAKSHVCSATVYDLRDVMKKMAQTVTTEDNFFFYSYSHGAYKKDEDMHCIVGWGNEKMRDTSFATFANAINANHSTYILNQCYAGGIIEHITLKNNMFLCASSARCEKTITAYKKDGSEYYDFAHAVIDGLQSGINNTQNLFDYADSYLDRYQNVFSSWPEQNPICRGSSFDLFDNLGRPISRKILPLLLPDEGLCEVELWDESTNISTANNSILACI